VVIVLAVKDAMTTQIQRQLQLMRVVFAVARTVHVNFVIAQQTALLSLGHPVTRG
jgi:hypothetical protein